MDDFFRRAWRPEQHVCLRLRLEPLQLGHVFLWDQYQIGFIRKQALDYTDLLLSVFIASQPWRESQRDLQKWWLPIFLRLWGLRTRKADYKKQADILYEYCKYHFSSPTIRINQERSRELGSVWWWRLAAVLMSDFGMAFDEALDQTVLRATALYVCRSETKGELELWNERDEDIWSFARTMDEKATVN